MELPREFVERMEKLLGQEAEALLEQYQQEDRLQGLRANSLKVSAGELEGPCPFLCGRCPGARRAFTTARKTGPACTPGTKPGFTICRSPAPWLWGC